MILICTAYYLSTHFDDPIDHTTKEYKHNYVNKDHKHVPANRMCSHARE